jgi:hypothetical protein
MIFDKAVLFKIGKFAGTREFFIISSSNKNLFKYLYPIFQKKVTNLLKKFYERKLNVSFSEIADYLEKKKMVISGSSILQAILCEDWDSDIDVYYKQKVDEKANKIMLPGVYADDLGKERRYNRKEDFPANILELSKTLNYGCHWYFGFKDIADIKITLVAEYQKKHEDVSKNILQEIGLANAEPIDFILKEFDLDILKNYLQVKNGILKIHFHNLYDCLNKITNYEPSKSAVQMFSRYTKYVDRGIRFYQSSDEILAMMNSTKQYFSIPLIVKKVGSGKFQFDDKGTKYGHEDQSSFGCDIFQIIRDHPDSNYFDYFNQYFTTKILPHYFYNATLHIKTSYDLFFIDNFFADSLDDESLKKHNSYSIVKNHRFSKYKLFYKLQVSTKLLESRYVKKKCANVKHLEIVLFVDE